MQVQGNKGWWNSCFSFAMESVIESGGDSNDSEDFKRICHVWAHTGQGVTKQMTYLEVFFGRLMEQNPSCTTKDVDISFIIGKESCKNCIPR